MATTIQRAGAGTSGQVSGVSGQRNLIVVSAAVSTGVVAYELYKTNPGRTQTIKTLGAVILLWGLVFVLGEFSNELGSAIAVFLLLVFLVARQGVVASIFTTAAPAAVS
jgi:hypothetical protein